MTDLELASILHCVTKLRLYLLGSEFTIETDLQSITSILTNKYCNSRIHNVVLEEYSFQITHISGKQNIIAGSLSRMDIQNKEKRSSKVVYINLIYTIYRTKRRQ